MNQLCVLNIIGVLRLYRFDLILNISLDFSAKERLNSVIGFDTIHRFLSMMKNGDNRLMALRI